LRPNTEGNGLTVKIKLGKGDVDAITAMTSLGTEQADTYIAIDGATIEDMAGTASAQQSENVVTYTDDATKPTFTGFTLDMTAETLTLTFSETVNGNSLVPTSITFRNQALDAGVQEVALTGGDVKDVPPYSTVVVLELLTVDLNKIKANTALATADSDTFISLADSSITDMTNSPLSIAATMYGAADGYTVDSTKPTLDRFELDIRTDEVTLTLTFSETVKRSSLHPTQFTLSNLGTGATDSFTLTGGPVTTDDTHEDSTIVTIALLKVDVDAIKEKTTLAISEANTFISFTVDAVRDMAVIDPNQIAALTTGLQAAVVQCAFSDRILHLRMPLDPTDVRLKRTGV
jgi:hypothetical protein